MKFKDSTLIEAGNVATALSGVIDLRYDYGLCYVCTFTGSPSGPVLLEGSIDQVTWIQIDSTTISGTTPISGNKDALYWPWLRISKASGGTGTMTVKICPKGA